VFPLIYLFASSERRFMSLEVQNRPISGTGPLIGSVVSSQASFLLYNICSLVKAHTCCLHWCWCIWVLSFGSNISESCGFIALMLLSDSCEKVNDELLYVESF